MKPHTWKPASMLTSHLCIIKQLPRQTNHVGVYICQIREQSQDHPECKYGRCLEHCKSAACVQMSHSGLPSQDSPSARRTYWSRPHPAASQNLHTPRGLPPTLAAVDYIHSYKICLDACVRNQVLDVVLYLASGSLGLLAHCATPAGKRRSPGASSCTGMAGSGAGRGHAQQHDAGLPGAL